MSDLDVIVAVAQRMTDVANESLQIAAKSKNVETRESRVRVALENVGRLLKLSEEHPAINLPTLDEFFRSMALIAAETVDLKRSGSE